MSGGQIYGGTIEFEFIAEKDEWGEKEEDQLIIKKSGTAFRAGSYEFELADDYVFDVNGYNDGIIQHDLGADLKVTNIDDGNMTIYKFGSTPRDFLGIDWFDFQTPTPDPWDVLNLKYIIHTAYPYEKGVKVKCITADGELSKTFVFGADNLVISPKTCK